MSARILGFISNRPELGARVLASHAQHLDVHTTADEPVGWGIGFYHGSELLLRRRPIDDRDLIPLANLVAVETDVLIGHVGRPNVGELRTENTQPFRYRQWLFAQLGELHDFETLREPLRDSQPDFLKRSRRGDSDAELLFYWLLSVLHETDHLHPAVVSNEALRAGLRRASLQLDRLSTQHSAAPSALDLLLTNGEHLALLHRSGTLATRVVSGRREVESFLGDDLGASARAASAEKARCSLVAGPLDELPESWQRLPHPAVVSLDRVEESVVETL